MKNTMVLEMINNGEIELLKQLLTEEIYNDSLKNNGNAKQRYSAMKRFFKYSVNEVNEALKLPCKDIMVHGEKYNSFVDGYCLALTKECIGEMETYNNDKYFDVARLINFSNVNSVENIDLNNVLAEAKSKGYKYKKSELDTNDYQYLFKYKDGYYKVGLLDKAFSIINDGEKAEVHYINPKALLLIKTNLGIAGVMPMHVAMIKGDKTIISLED